MKRPHFLSPLVLAGLRVSATALALHTLVTSSLILLRGSWPRAGDLQRQLDAPVNHLSYLAGNALEPVVRWALQHSSLSVSSAVLICELAVYVIFGGILYAAVTFPLGVLCSAALASMKRRGTETELDRRAP